MKRLFKAVMHCTVKEISKLIDLGNKVTAGLSANTNPYSGPVPSVAELEPEVDALELLSGQAKGNRQQKQARDQQALRLFNMLLEETRYVNSVAKGDRALILLSGFDASSEPSPHPVPGAAVIQRIVDGSSPHSAKIFLAKTTGPLNTKKASLTYILQMCTDPSKEENWKTVLQTQNSRKLVIINLTRGQEVFFRISVMNARGQSDWSEMAAFIPQ